MLPDNTASKTIYKNVLAIAMVITIIAIPLIGKLADSVPASTLLPISFLMRGVLIAQFDLITDPRSFYSHILSVTVILASTLQFIVVNSYFLRNLPNGIRGTLLGFYNGFGQQTDIFYLLPRLLQSRGIMSFDHY